MPMHILDRERTYLKEFLCRFEYFFAAFLAFGKVFERKRRKYFLEFV
jgi:hypothetical protein